MKREHFIVYIEESHKCQLVRHDKRGYSVYRNPENDKMSGVPADNPLRTASICMACFNLIIPPPDVLHEEYLKFAKNKQQKNL